MQTNKKTNPAGKLLILLTQLIKYQGWDTCMVHYFLYKKWKYIYFLKLRK
jgi:hypothetical protein